MTKKSLREKLTETSSRPDARNSTRNLAVFLEHWREVDKAFREGWPYKEIWRALSEDGDIDFSYSAFLNLVRKVRRRHLEHDRGKRGEATTRRREPPPRFPR